MTYPTVYPTGATLYDPQRCWNGYTIFQAKELGALLIDMNGREVRLWRGLHGFPNKMLPGGYVLGHSGERNTRYGVQDYLDLLVVDWEGKVVWRFDRYQFIQDPGEEGRWMARLHHDYQLAGNPVGYYIPDWKPHPGVGPVLILGHRNLVRREISDKVLLDDTIYEVDSAGEVTWEWVCSEHFAEFDFREEAKNILARNPNLRPVGEGEGVGDWMHLNSMSTLGPNRWYDRGDERFRPDNIIVSGRETNLIFIISRATGQVVWKLGPYYDLNPRLRELGWIIGPHHAHMIPRGLPGEGHILVFDNGGWAGYGAPNPGSPTGLKNALRDYSRVLEIDPLTLKIVWQYTPREAGLMHPTDSNRFYSPFISGAQRLPNGNTLITEGSGGRIIEVTPDHQLVWEYISPHWGRYFRQNMVYRAYRVPYDWVPQLDPPRETPIPPLDVTRFRVPGAAPPGPESEVRVEGTLPYQPSSAMCVITTADHDQ